jgi:hypothetical protein
MVLTATGTLAIHLSIECCSWLYAHWLFTFPWSGASSYGNYSTSSFHGVVIIAKGLLVINLYTELWSQLKAHWLFICPWSGHHGYRHTDHLSMERCTLLYCRHTGHSSFNGKVLLDLGTWFFIVPQNCAHSCRHTEYSSFQGVVLIAPGTLVIHLSTELCYSAHNS